jgi:hypothetical protein
LREWDSKREGSLTTRLAELQKERNVPRPVAEKIVKEDRRGEIPEMLSQRKKVQ